MAQYPAKSCGDKSDHGQHIFVDGHAYACFGYHAPRVTPLEVLRHHVSGAVERGEAESIVEVRAATEDETNRYLSGHSSFPGSTETEHGLEVRA